MNFYFLLLPAASAWEINTDTLGNEQRWLQTPINFSINTDGKHDLAPEAVEGAIMEAAAVWDCTKYGGYLYFEYAGTTKISEVSHLDEQNAISFSDTWTEDPDLLALTYAFTTSDGELIHFDMRINSHFHVWTLDGENGTNDLQNTMAHEFGHAIGMGHSEDLTATMAPTATPGEIEKRDLNEDDIDGFVYLYNGEAPNMNDESPPLFGCNSVPSGDANQADDQDVDEDNDSLASGGLGPSGPSSTGGSLMPIEKGGCTTAPTNPSLAALLGVILFGFLRKRKEDER